MLPRDGEYRQSRAHQLQQPIFPPFPLIPLFPFQASMRHARVRSEQLSTSDDECPLPVRLTAVLIQSDTERRRVGLSDGSGGGVVVVGGGGGGDGPSSGGQRSAA